ncbi:TRAP transporter small permease subunit [Thalassotalea sediminis]|uniref:TRAP transporter small permease subunit n=1 Tax=Thalassotalea sediminis TaxID=1759089 RepID=UPI0025731AC4|nr:TRAP transporter small permease subunit [Thalassotalea sediminis]
MPLIGIDKIVQGIDKFTEYTGKLIAWFTVIMVLLTFTIVLLRYGFSLGWIAMQESVLYFHGFAFMLGAAYTLKHDKHVRVDIFYQKFSKRNQARVNFFGSLLLLIPVCIATAVISWQYVATSWQIMEKSGEAGGLPLVFVSKSLLILLPITLGLQGFAELLRSYIQMTADQEQN